MEVKKKKKYIYIYIYISPPCHILIFQNLYVCPCSWFLANIISYISILLTKTRSHKSQFNKHVSLNYIKAYILKLFSATKRETRRERVKKKKKKKKTYKAIIINSENILLLGDKEGKGTTSWVLVRNARGPRTQNLINIVTIV